MLQKTFIILISFNLLHEISMVIVKEYTATTSYQYAEKTSSMYNGDYIWRLTPSSGYTVTSYYMEIYWEVFTVQGVMPTCEPDFVEVFIHEYRSTRGSILRLRYRLRSRTSSYMGSYSSTSCTYVSSYSPVGYIYSSGYPRSYKTSSSSCYYKIITSSGKETRIVLMDVNLNCKHYVRITGSYFSSSTYSTSTYIGGFKCSNHANVVTRYTYIHVRFYRYQSSTTGWLIGSTSGSSTGYRGFILSYIVYDINTAVPTKPGTCTFEVDECGFTQNTSDHFNWLRHKGLTSSPHTGPSIDHNTGLSRGYYMYTEASSPRMLGHRAIISKQYSNIATEGSCLAFWYHLYGSTVGQLNVYLKNMSIDPLMSPVWSLTGEQGDRWEMGQVTMTRNHPVVIIEGVIGKSFYGDIAIDDVLLTNGKCSSPVPDNEATFSIQHRNGKLCISWNKLNDEAVFTQSCNELFSFTKDGALFHILSGKCLAPIATASNSLVMLQSACHSANAWFYRTSSDAIRHLRTGKCIQAYQGSSTPMPATNITINSGCGGAAWQFDFIKSEIPTTRKPSTTTNKPSTTTEKPSTTTKKPSTTTKKPSTATKKPSATTEKPSTTTKKPSTTTKKPSTTTEKPSTTTEKPSTTTEKPSTTTEKPSTTTEKPSTTTMKPSTTTKKSPKTTDKLSTAKYLNEAGDKGQKQSDDKSNNVLTISVIAVCTIAFLIFMVLATYCITQWKKAREMGTRESVQIHSNQSVEKAANLYFRDPTGRSGAFSGHRSKRPLPGIPSSANKAKFQKNADGNQEDISDILRKQSIAIPASFSDPVFNQTTSKGCDASLPGISLRFNRSEGAISTTTLCHSVRENDVIDEGNNDFIAMKPIQSHQCGIQEEMYLDLNEVKDDVTKYQSMHIYEPMQPSSNDIQRKGLPKSTLSTRISPRPRNHSDPMMPTRMEDLEHKLSQIIDLIEGPVIKNRQKSLPSPRKFDSGLPRKFRQGSCPNIREPFVVANQSALQIGTGEHIQEKIEEEEEEEEYLAPNQLHAPLNQRIREMQTTYEADDIPSKPCDAKDSKYNESTILKQRPLQPEASTEKDIDFVKTDLEKLPSEDTGIGKRGTLEEVGVQNGNGAERRSEDSEINLEKKKDGNGDMVETYYQAVIA